MCRSRFAFLIPFLLALPALAAGQDLNLATEGASIVHAEETISVERVQPGGASTILLRIPYKVEAMHSSYQEPGSEVRLVVGLVVLAVAVLVAFIVIATGAY